VSEKQHLKHSPFQNKRSHTHVHTRTQTKTHTHNVTSSLHTLGVCTKKYNKAPHRL